MTSPRLLVLQPPVPTGPVALESLFGAPARDASAARALFAHDAAALVRGTGEARALVSSAAAYRRALLALLAERVFDAGRANVRRARAELVLFEYRLALVLEAVEPGAHVLVADTSVLVEAAAVAYALVAALQQLAAGHAATGARSSALHELVHALTVLDALEAEVLASFAPLAPPVPTPHLRECALMSPALLATVRHAVLGAYYVAEATAARPSLAEATLLLRAATAFAAASAAAPTSATLRTCGARATAYAYRRLARELLAEPTLPEWAAGVAVAAAEESAALATAHGDGAAAAAEYAAEVRATNEHVRGAQAVPRALQLVFVDGGLALERLGRRAVRVTLPRVAIAVTSETAALRANLRRQAADAAPAANTDAVADERETTALHANARRQATGAAPAVNTDAVADDDETAADAERRRALASAPATPEQAPVSSAAGQPDSVAMYG